MVKTKQQIEHEIREKEGEIDTLKEELRPLELAERIRHKWEIGFGWPRISQELGLKAKLDEETYDKLYNEVAKIVDEVARMVEDPARLTTWQKIKSLFQ